MGIDLSDLDRLTGIAEALERLFWCLIVVALFAAVLGSHGTGLLLLFLGGAAFVVRTGLEDFVRARREPETTAEPAAPKKKKAAPKSAAEPEAAAEPGFTVYRAERRSRRRTKSAV